MQVTTSSVPGVGTLHDLRTRDAHHLRLIIERNGERHLVIYGTEGADEPMTTVSFDTDEADHVSDLLHSRSVPDRLAEVERKLTELADSKR
jgi:TrkA domain protein